MLREKGRAYFKGVEILGSNIGTEKYPKMSLLGVTKNKLIPTIEDKVVTKYDDGGRINVCVVYQENGAGLHQDKTCLHEKRRSSKSRLGNIQPTSPITHNEYS